MNSSKYTKAAELLAAAIRELEADSKYSLDCFELEQIRTKLIEDSIRPQ